MKDTKKSLFLGVISLLLVIGFSVPATTYAWRGNMTFSNIGNIYMPGYTVSSGFQYPPYTQAYGARNSYGQYGYGQSSGYRWTTSTWPAQSIDPWHDTLPVYGYSSQPSYGYSYGYGGTPTGDYDFLGTPLCQWYDYNGRTPCAYDPHQWIYDPYTGSWY